MNLRTTWLAAIILLLVPAGMLLLDSKMFTPLVAFLISFAQFFLALYIGKLQSEDAARTSANAKWLPPAESACDRLLTVKASVLGLQQQTKGACSKSSDDLPELKAEQNKAIRMVFERYCSEISSRLIDVQNHLEGAFEDWIRFIRQNCEGPECQRIWNTLMARKSSLNASTKTETCDSRKVESPLPNSSAMTAMISGADDGVDGIHELLQDGLLWRSPRFILHKLEIGWCMTDLRTGQFRFIKQHSEQDDSPAGMYLSCPTCKGGGVASVDQIAPFFDPTPLARVP